MSSTETEIVVSEIRGLPEVIRENIFGYADPYRERFDESLDAIRVKLLKYNAMTETCRDGIRRKYTFEFAEMHHLSRDDYMKFIYKYFIDEENVFQAFIIFFKNVVKVRVYRELSDIKFLKSFFDEAGTGILEVTNNPLELEYARIFMRRVWADKIKKVQNTFFVQTPGYLTQGFDYVYNISYYPFLKNVCSCILKRLEKFKEPYLYTDSYSVLTCELTEMKNMENELLSIREQFGNDLNLLSYV